MNTNNSNKPSLIRFVTVGLTANILLRPQLEFLSNHFDLTVAAAEDAHLTKLRKETDLNIVKFPFVRDISLLQDLKALIFTYRFLQKHKPDIIHANTPKASLLSMIAGYLAKVSVRIYTVTGVRYQTATGNKRRLLKMMERLTCHFATHINVEGPGVKKFYASENITGKSLDIIGFGSLCGIPIDKFDPVKAEGANLITEKESIKYDPDFTYILAVGRVVADKGIPELIEAFKVLRQKNKKLRLILLGPYEKNLDSLPDVTEDYIEKSADVFHIPWSDSVEKYMYLADILVHASYREGFPNSPLQAGAMGLPVICSQISGNTDIVTNEETGLYFEVKNSADLISKLEFALSNMHITKSYAGNLKKEVLEKYPDYVIHNNILNYYYDKLNKKHS